MNLNTSTLFLLIIISDQAASIYLTWLTLKFRTKRHAYGNGSRHNADAWASWKNLPKWDNKLLDGSSVRMDNWSMLDKLKSMSRLDRLKVFAFLHGSLVFFYRLSHWRSVVFDRKIIIKRDQGSSNQSHMSRSNERLQFNELWKIQIQMEFMKINKPLSAMNFEDVRRLLNGYDSSYMSHIMWFSATFHFRTYTKLTTCSTDTSEVGRSHVLEQIGEFSHENRTRELSDGAVELGAIFKIVQISFLPFREKWRHKWDQKCFHLSFIF